MLKMTVLAAALAVATSASAFDFRGQGGYGGGHAPYGYGDSTSALGRYCPPGYYPHSFPSGSGIRCTSVGGDIQFDSGHH